MADPAWRCAPVAPQRLVVGLEPRSLVGSEIGSPVGSSFFIFFNSLTKVGVTTASVSA
jgi:hypothetical protein